MTKEEAGAAAFLVLGIIMQMSDDAQKLGGSTSIAGIASLHKMQKSIQKNGPRLAELYKAWNEQ